MADIELAIKIPEEMYKWVYDVNKFFNDYGMGDFIDLIKNGTPLPKGHGRLIDGDSLKNCFHYGEANTNNENDMIMAVRRIIESVPTVIEADKEK